MYFHILWLYFSDEFFVCWLPLDADVVSRQESLVHRVWNSYAWSNVYTQTRQHLGRIGNTWSMGHTTKQWIPDDHKMTWEIIQLRVLPAAEPWIACHRSALDLTYIQDDDSQHQQHADGECRAETNSPENGRKRIVSWWNYLFMMAAWLWPRKA